MTQPGISLAPSVPSSNGVAISPELFSAMTDSTELRGDPSRLRSRFADEGYLLLRGVLDRDEVLALRASYFAQYDPVLLAGGTTARDGIFSGVRPPGLPPYGTAGHPAFEFVRSAQFDAFTRRPALAQLAQELLGAPVTLRQRRILRHFDRAERRASRAHVDFDYMNRGTAELVTMWVPLGDCPPECGGLVYLTGSHRLDAAELDRLRSVTDRPGDHRPVSHDLDRTARALGGSWARGNFRAGDVLVHCPTLVHASLDNQSDVMRLSVDLRFQVAGSSVDDRWNSDWSADDGY